MRDFGFEVSFIVDGGAREECAVGVISAKDAYDAIDTAFHFYDDNGRDITLVKVHELGDEYYISMTKNALFDRFNQD